MPLRDEYLRALATLDLRASRKIVTDAAAGASLARIYVDLVRPALESTRGAWSGGAEGTTSARLVLGSVEAALAVVASRPLEGAAMRGEGRHALVSVGSGPLDALDGQVIVDTLCADGWTVSEVAAGEDAEAVARLAEEHRVQLVVMPTSNPADLLLSAQAYTRLRRLADPPVIVACSLGRPDETSRARSVGADAFVNDPEDLLRFVDRRLPRAGERNWGVRLRRLGDTLVVAPTGDLDPGSIMRLRQVVDSRNGSFRALVIDARDVASLAPAGFEALVGWLEEAAAAGRSHRVIAGPLLEAALRGAAVDAALLAQPVDAG